MNLTIAKTDSQPFDGFTTAAESLNIDGDVEQVALESIDNYDFDYEDVIIVPPPTKTSQQSRISDLMMDTDATIIMWGSPSSPEQVFVNCCFLQDEDRVNEFRGSGVPSFYLPLARNNIKYIINQVREGSDKEYLYHYGSTTPIGYSEDEDSSEEVSHVKEVEGMDDLSVCVAYYGDTCSLNATLDSLNDTWSGDVTIARPSEVDALTPDDVVECGGLNITEAAIDVGYGAVRVEDALGYTPIKPFIDTAIPDQYSQCVCVEQGYTFEDGEVLELFKCLTRISGESNTVPVVIGTRETNGSDKYVELLEPDNQIDGVTSELFAWNRSDGAYRFFLNVRVAMGWSFVTGNMDTAFSMAANASSDILVCVTLKGRANE